VKCTFCSAPPDPLAIFKGPTSKGREGRRGRGRGRKWGRGRGLEGRGEDKGGVGIALPLLKS